MAVHVGYESLYISLLSSAKQQREMNKFCVFLRTRREAVHLQILFGIETQALHV